MHAWLSRKHFSPNGFSGSLVMFMDIQMTLGMYFILVLYFCLMVFEYRFLVYFKDCIDQEAGTEYYYLYPRSKSSRWMPSLVIADNIIEVSVPILSEIFPLCAFLSLALLGACRLYTDFFFQLSELKSWKGIFFFLLVVPTFMNFAGANYMIQKTTVVSVDPIFKLCMLKPILKHSFCTDQT